MLNTKGLALSPFESALLDDNYPAFDKDAFRIWKALLLSTILLLSLTSSPTQGAFEKNLSAENLLQVLNSDRQQNGLPFLRPDPKLAKAAATKAQDILARGYFAHISPQGARPWDFIANEGFRYSYAGENLALNYTSSYELENDFLKSPSHRDNLLSSLFSEVGIAVAEGMYEGKPAVVTVQMFARPQRLSASDGGQAGQ